MSVTQIHTKPRRVRSVKDDGWRGFLFVLPNLVGFLVFTVIPIVFALCISFTDWDFYKGFGGIEWVGLKNYQSLPGDIWFTDSLKNNLIYTVGTIPVVLVASLLLANALNAKIFGRKAVRTMIFMPYVVNTVAIAAVGMLLFNPTNGPINQVLRAIGIQNPPGWFSSLEWALPGVMVLSIWQQIGYDMIIYLAGLQSVPEELYESATVDGANSVQKLIKITVPMLSPTTFFLLITNIISSFQVFGMVNVLTRGGPGRATTVLAYYIYRSAFRYNKMGLASAIAFVLFGLVLVVTLIQWRVQKKQSEIY